MEYARGTEYKIPIILACYGLRRSEIYALTPADIGGDAVSISKSQVLSDSKEWIIKTTKTTASTREVIIPLDVVEKIREQGYVLRGALSVPEADIMRAGGWETDYVMKSVYRHAMEDKNKAAQREASQRFH